MDHSVERRAPSVSRGVIDGQRANPDAHRPLDRGAACRWRGVWGLWFVAQGRGRVDGPEWLNGPHPEATKMQQYFI